MELRHLFSQGRVLASLATAAFDAIDPRRAGRAPTNVPSLPTEWLHETVAGRSNALVTDYVRHVGGDPSWYRDTLPPHLFPQWGFPLAAKALATLPYPLARVVNAGCRLEQRAPLPRGQRLHVRARVEAVDDDGRRARLTTTIVTGTDEAPDALIATLHAHVSLASSKVAAPSRATRPLRLIATVPADARELASIRLPANAGFTFAALTGDVNPIHWLAPYARAAGFHRCILHGFSSLARTYEALDRARLSSDSRRLATLEVRFVRPLPLPAHVGVYARGEEVWMGRALGGAAFLEGTYSRTKP